MDDAELSGQLGITNLALSMAAIADQSAIAPADRRYVWIARTGEPDRSGRVTNPLGWDLDSFKKNPAIFASHNWMAGKWPIGVATAIDATASGLLATTRFATTPEARQVQDLVDQGIIVAMSAAWIGLDVSRREDDDRFTALYFDRSQLMELSIIPLGDDPRAVRTAALFGGPEYSTSTELTSHQDDTAQIVAAIAEMKELIK